MRIKLKTLSDKVIVAFVYMLIVEIAVALGLAINFMSDYHFFTDDSGVYPVQKAMSQKVEKEYDALENYITLYLKGEHKRTEAENAYYESLSQKYAKGNTNMVFIATKDDGTVIMKNGNMPDDFCYSSTSPFRVYTEDDGISEGLLKLYIPTKDHMHISDGYSMALNMVNFAYSVRVIIFIVLFILICLAAFLLGLLMSNIGSGSDSRDGKIGLGFIDRIPFDLFSLISILLIAFIVIMIMLTSAADIQEISIVLWNLVMLIMTFIISLILLVYCLTLASRIKTGHLMKNTLIYRAISRIRKKRDGDSDGYFKVPILGKALITIGIIMLIELVSIFYFVYKYQTCDSGQLEDFKFLYFAVIQFTILFVVSALFFMIVFNLNRVRESGKKIASGDFDSVVDSHIMFGDFKAINDDLITIKDDMIKALEEKNKSQELRSELITNISHDIKTPLTSIVNYADIISSGKCDPDEIKIYSNVISNQSAKLSDLLFNLIEVSKISSGSVKVEFDDVNVALFLSQTLEEFSIRFIEKKLVLEQNLPDEDIYIRADGMKLWRVFENLLGNIIKYAMPNTRIYLDVECVDEKVIISLKNISEKPINSSAEELLMRFKRDDNSRHTEGNGLGLSIAKSFTEIQKGTFDISVDGDLFKTVITFDRINPEA